MTYSVKFYRSARGEQPVREFIAKIDEQTKAKFSHLYDLLCDYAKYRDIYILLHAFKKKTQKTPAKELHIAQQRWTEI